MIYRIKEDWLGNLKYFVKIYVSLQMMIITYKIVCNQFNS